MYNSKNARWNANMPGVLKPTPARRVLIKPWTLFKAVFVGTLGLVGQAYMIQGAAQPNVSSVYPYPGRGNVAAHGAFYRRHGGPQKIEPIYGNIGGHKTNLAVAYRHWPRAHRNWKLVPKGVNITGRFPTQKSDDAAICALGGWFHKMTGLGGQFVGAQCGFAVARMLGLLRFLDSSAFQASFVVLGAYLLAMRRAKFLADEEEKWRAQELSKMTARMGILRSRADRQNSKANIQELREQIAGLGKMIQSWRKGDAARRRKKRSLIVAVHRAEKEANRLAGAVAKGEVVVVPNESGGVRAIPVGAKNNSRQANNIYKAFNATAYPMPRSLARASSAPVRGAANNKRNALKALASALRQQR